MQDMYARGGEEKRGGRLSNGADGVGMFFFKKRRAVKKTGRTLLK